MLQIDKPLQQKMNRYETYLNTQTETDPDAIQLLAEIKASVPKGFKAVQVCDLERMQWEMYITPQRKRA